MEQETIQQPEYRYSLEVGHAKQGSDHVLIIKSLKVRDDNLADVVAQLEACLESVKEIFVDGGFTQ